MTLKVDLAARALPPRAIATLARRAEATGFDAIVVNETNHDSIVAAAAAIMATERIAVTTSVTIAFPRSPTVLAMAAWDLQSLSGGRFTIGLGPQVKGHIERRFGLPWTAPVPRMRDYLGAVRALWRSFQTGDPLAYQSASYTMTLLTAEFNPGPIDSPPPPIHLAAVNPAMCRLIGEAADGFRAHPLTSPKYLAEVVLPNIRAGAAKAGRDPSSIEIVATAFHAIGDTDDAIAAAREEARRSVAFYGSTRAYRPIFAAHSLDDVADRLNRLAAAGQWDAMPKLVPDDVLDLFCLTGKTDDLPRLVRAHFGDRITRYALVFIPPAVFADLDRLRDLVRRFRAVNG